MNRDTFATLACRNAGRFSFCDIPPKGGVLSQKMSQNPPMSQTDVAIGKERRR
jgi:hypothetical protein